MLVRDLLKKIYRYLRPPQDHWAHFVSILDRPTLTHDPSLDEVGKRALFKRNITLVELEPHAYCNRTCSFCPNSTIDRLTVKTMLNRSLYEGVLGDLRSIDYDKVLRFARYSEPMADDHIYEMVALARQHLPKAVIDIVTTGDYLDAESLNRLREMGLSVLRISVYMRKGVAWSAANAEGEINRLAKRIEIMPVWDQPTATTVGAVFPYSGMKVVVYSHNFDETGYDRGQLIESLVDHAYVRRSPCFLVFSNFTVDFNGKIMPCCNLRSDHPDHQAFVLGDLSDRRQSIFDVYADQRYTEWRCGLATVGEKQSPCNTCKQKTLEGPALDQLRLAVDAKLDSLGVQI
ncbi:MAG: SPASM domain-containing protein [Nitrospirota bacterium]|nr:SPASM domain-containing protein [Nitrospirota bacterium]